MYYLEVKQWSFLYLDKLIHFVEKLKEEVNAFYALKSTDNKNKRVNNKFRKHETF